MTKFNTVSHVIFDLDGLLLDTEKFYFQVAKEICQLYGKEYTWRHREHTFGWFGMEAAKYVVNDLNLPISPEVFYNEAVKKYKALFPTATLMSDSEGFYLKVFTAIAAQYNKEYSWDVRMKVLGTVESDSARIMVENLKLPISPEEFTEQEHERLRSLLPNCLLMPGAERLIRHLHTNGIPIAVATSSSRESVALKSTNYKELFALFHHLVSGTSDPEVKKGKPAPDIFLVCASKFPDCPPPEKILVFEDAPNGVTAARAAGMQVVMVPDSKIQEEKRQDATLVIKSLLDFKPQLFGLPPF